MTVQGSDVQGTLGETDLSETDLQPFIDAAGRLYDPLASGVTDEVRDDVVEQLAAHLVKAGPERQVSSVSEGDGSVSFEGETGMGLQGTTYGQMAIMLDPTGQLAKQDAPSVDFEVF